MQQNAQIQYPETKVKFHYSSQALCYVFVD
jgi:hypothetical protein